VLPHFCEWHPALSRSGRRGGKNASGRRTALIVADEELDFAPCSIVANVCRRHDGSPVGFTKRNSGTVHSGAVTTFHDAIRPSMNVGALFGEHAPALFLIEKNNGVSWKTLRCGRSQCRSCVTRAEAYRIA